MATVKEEKPENKRDDAASAEALKTVLSAVEKLSEADRDRVIQSVVKFYNVYVS